MRIENLIGNTYQVVDNDDSILFQNTIEECVKYMIGENRFRTNTNNTTLKQLDARIDKLGEDIEWLQESMSDLKERIEALYAQK